MEVKQNETKQNMNKFDGMALILVDRLFYQMKKKSKPQLNRISECICWYGSITASMETENEFLLCNKTK